MKSLLKMLDPAEIGALLENIEKPGRYIGNEFGIKSKNPDYLLKNPATVNTALVFPDVYEVGMSNLGLQILYKIINSNPLFNAERAFSPWPDFEDRLRKSKTKLFSLENRIFLDCFDLIGFNAAHEMLYTNILNAIDLSGLSIRSLERKALFPLVCCGGSSAVNPWPLSAFMDFMVIGDGEHVISQILGIISNYKEKYLNNSSNYLKSPANLQQVKKEMLFGLSSIEGVFVPSFYSLVYNSDNTIKKIIHTGGSSGITGVKKIRKAVLKDIDSFDTLSDPVVPNIQTVHDRLNIEIMRGCGRGCRFCQAGFTYRPLRQKKVKNLIEKSIEGLLKTGYDEISFTSLSSSDYKELKKLIEKVTESGLFEKISVSLPSLRLDSFSLEIAEIIQSGRKTGLTFAPEAGSQRLRDIIKKDISADELRESIRAAFLKGWTKVKLYFMLGLPFETDDDIKAIAETTNEIIYIAKQCLDKRSFSRLQISVSINAFCPKPFTPFQWCAQENIFKLEEKIRALQQSISSRFVRLHWNSPEKSSIECAFSRGDSRLPDVIEAAWKKGARFDNWTDYFDYGLWVQSFSIAGADPGFYTTRQYGLDEVLPWDVIDIGIKKDYFIKEFNKAAAGIRLNDNKI
ncbi:MAG: TIGR03960 family B12-binding radical SAM protein [Actinobacteria bacterium]|nr:TIGR03960 family B12-binding radical SAM protein [Actinomycetota bacterium]